jgi:predicted dehydrogenase
MAQRSYTVGIIGLGYGRAHIPAFQGNGCTVVAVCQRNLETARAVADRYGIPRAFERWEQMLSEARPEIVVVATPPHLHHRIVTEAFGAGAHVLCEKPMAMDAAEARAMTEAARRAGRVGMIGFNWRFPAAMQRFHEMAEAGHLGRVFHVSARWLGGRWADEAISPTWRMDRSQAGHGAMGDMGVHLIDLVRWNFGEVKRVWAHAGVAYPGRTVPGGDRPADTDDFCIVVAELGSGAQVTLTVSRVARGVNEHGLEAYGTTGALGYRLTREGKRWYQGELSAASTGSLEPVRISARLPRTAGEGDPMEVIGKATIGPLVKRFLAGIRKGESPSPSFEDGASAQAVLDAVRESITRGSWASVDEGAGPLSR